MNFDEIIAKLEEKNTSLDELVTYLYKESKTFASLSEKEQVTLLILTENLPENELEEIIKYIKGTGKSYKITKNWLDCYFRRINSSIRLDRKSLYLYGYFIDEKGMISKEGQEVVAAMFNLLPMHLKIAIAYLINNVNQDKKIKLNAQHTIVYMNRKYKYYLENGKEAFYQKYIIDNRHIKRTSFYSFLENTRELTDFEKQIADILFGNLKDERRKIIEDYLNGKISQGTKEGSIASTALYNLKLKFNEFRESKTLPKKFSEYSYYDYFFSFSKTVYNTSELTREDKKIIDILLNQIPKKVKKLFLEFADDKREFTVEEKETISYYINLCRGRYDTYLKTGRIPKNYVKKSIYDYFLDELGNITSKDKKLVDLIVFKQDEERKEELRNHLNEEFRLKSPRYKSVKSTIAMIKEQFKYCKDNPQRISKLPRSKDISECFHRNDTRTNALLHVLINRERYATKEKIYQYLDFEIKTYSKLGNEIRAIIIAANDKAKKMIAKLEALKNTEKGKLIYTKLKALELEFRSRKISEEEFYIHMWKDLYQNLDIGLSFEESILLFIEEAHLDLKSEEVKLERV